LFLSSRYQSTQSNKVRDKSISVIQAFYSLGFEPIQVSMGKQLTEKSITRVTIGCIDIEYMSAKKAKDVVISL